VGSWLRVQAEGYKKIARIAKIAGNAKIEKQTADGADPRNEVSQRHCRENQKQGLPQMNADNRRDPMIAKTTLMRSTSSLPEWDVSFVPDAFCRAAMLL